MAPKSRLSELPPAPKPPARIHPTSVISEAASLTGTHPIVIGSNSVIHPRAKLISTNGPVTIGDYCIISERAVIAAPDQDGLEIENYVSVETNAVVEARRIGEGTSVEVGVKIGKGAVVGRVSTLFWVVDYTARNWSRWEPWELELGDGWMGANRACCLLTELQTHPTKQSRRERGCRGQHGDLWIWAEENRHFGEQGGTEKVDRKACGGIEAIDTKQ